MASRALLSINVLDEFKDWLKEKGFTIYDTKGIFEVLRAKKENKWVIVFLKTGAREHLSVRDEDVRIVRKFIEERKERENKHE